MTLDPRWPVLLAAGRSWRRTLIPKTSTGVAGPTRVLLEAIEAFDEPEPAVPFIAEDEVVDYEPDDFERDKRVLAAMRGDEPPSESQPVCPHPRSTRVYLQDGRQQCGTCGAYLP